MANIQIKKDGGPGMATAAPAREWDPLRMMREMLAWDPFQRMAPLAVPEGGLPAAFEVKETKDGYLFHADVPGVRQEDIDVTATGNRLTIAGKREAEKEEKGDTFYTYERNYGTFNRAFTLPEGAEIEKVKADLKDGVLTVFVPKRPEVQPRKIEVKAEKH